MCFCTEGRFAYFVFVLCFWYIFSCLCGDVITYASDSLERLVSEMTHCVEQNIELYSLTYSLCDF